MWRTSYAPDFSTNKVYMTLFFKISKKTNYRSRDIHIIHNQKHFQASTIDSQILADFLIWKIIVFRYRRLKFAYCISLLFIVGSLWFLHRLSSNIYRIRWLKKTNFVLLFAHKKSVFSPTQARFLARRSPLPLVS